MIAAPVVYGPHGTLPANFEPDEHARLLQEHADVGKRYAALWAEYGSDSLLDNQRKAYLSTIAARVREEALRANTKVTEGFVDEQAHASPDYRDWLMEQEVGRLAFQLTALDLERVRARLRHLDQVGGRGL